MTTEPTGELKQRIQAIKDQDIQLAAKRTQEEVARQELVRARQELSARLTREFVAMMIEHDVPTVSYFGNESEKRTNPLGDGWIVRQYSPFRDGGDWPDSSEVIGLIVMTTGETYEWTGAGTRSESDESKLVSKGFRGNNPNYTTDESPLPDVFADRNGADFLARKAMDLIASKPE